MYLNLTEAGRRINKSRTIVGKLIDDGLIDGYIDPRSGRRCVLEADIAKYLASYRRCKITQESHVSQPLQNIG
jgi:hypothetical protein